MIAMWTASKDAVHFSRALYRFLSNACLWGVLDKQMTGLNQWDNVLAIQLKPHSDLINSTLDLPLQNKIDQ